MNCEMARELMLEADLADLSPAGTSDLARHLRDCAACGARAERIVANTRSLAVSVRAMRPSVDLGEAQERAAAAAGAIRARQRMWRRARLVTPLALAAGIGALLLLDGRHSGPETPAVPPAPFAALSAFDVETPAGANVAVFRTDNPQIVVIWYF